MVMMMMCNDLMCLTRSQRTA